MKLFTLIVGMALGAGLCYVALNPKSAERAAKRGIEDVSSTVQGARRGKCVRDYLRESSCFQQFSDEECDARIIQECGPPQ
jgi:hypothetical protein